MLFFLVTYVLPMVGLSITYCHLGTVLWKDDNGQQHSRTKHKRNVRVPCLTLAW